MVTRFDFESVIRTRRSINVLQSEMARKAVQTLTVNGTSQLSGSGILSFGMCSDASLTWPYSLDRLDCDL